MLCVLRVLRVLCPRAATPPHTHTYTRPSPSPPRSPSPPPQLFDEDMAMLCRQSNALVEAAHAGQLPAVQAALLAQ